MKQFIRILLVALAVPFFGTRFMSAHGTANAESSTGTHRVFNRLADAAHSYTHLLVKTGSDADHVAVCGAADFPLGTTDDAPDAAEDLINVHGLGGPCTRKVRVATGLAEGVDLYTAASGFAQAEPAVAGTFYKVGRSIAAANQVGAGNYVIEFLPCEPVRTVVVAALTSTNGTAAGAADLAALKTEAEKIGDDIRALAAALATPSVVKVLAA